MFSIPQSKLKEGGVPKRFWNVSLEKFDTLSTKQRQRLRRWVADSEHGTRTDLLISGKPQTGKTSLGTLVMLSLAARRGYNLSYVDLRTLVDHYFNRGVGTEHRDFYQNCLSCDVLVIDDCARHQSEGCFIVLDYVYRARHSAELITILICEEDETFAPVLAVEFGEKLANKIKRGSLHISLSHDE